MREELVIIDPQNDFCDSKGSLFVPGATEDMTRLAGFISKRGDLLQKIHVSLDSHPRFHIAHGVFWKDQTGKHLAPFTQVTHADVKSGKYVTTRVADQRWSLEYTESLERHGRYPLFIWPEHCKIGTWGQQVIGPVNDALDDWAGKGRWVNWVTKGSNPRTEHYSAIQADVEIDDDQTTKKNFGFLNVINKADIIYLSGEAGSHCLANTGRDMVSFFNDDSFIRKLVLLKDATSPVPSFEKQQDDFINELSAKGMRVALTTDF